MATNAVAAGLLAAAVLFYVFVYTVWLKRRTPQNIVIGGAAGAFPPAIGWAAVTGNVGIEAAILFALIFFWTPPHFWALALYRSQDYAAAGVPMLPVVRGARATKWQMLAYTVLLLPLALMPCIAGFASWVYRYRTRPPSPPGRWCLRWSCPGWHSRPGCRRPLFSGPEAASAPVDDVLPPGLFDG